MRADSPEAVFLSLLRVGDSSQRKLRPTRGTKGRHENRQFDSASKNADFERNQRLWADLCPLQQEIARRCKYHARKNAVIQFF